jgi:hypothetical protein
MRDLDCQALRNKDTTILCNEQSGVSGSLMAGVVWEYKEEAFRASMSMEEVELDMECDGTEIMAKEQPRDSFPKVKCLPGFSLRG